MQLRRDLRTPGGLLAAPLGIALLDTAGINVDAIGRCAPTQIDVTVFDAALDVEAVRLFGEIVREGSVADVHTCAHRGRGTARTRDRVRLHELGGAGADAARFRLRGPRARRRRHARPAAPHRRVRRGAPAGGGYVLDGLSARVGADSLHQGPIQVMLEAAALDVARATWPRPMRSTPSTPGRRSCSAARPARLSRRLTCWPTTGPPSPASRSCATTAKAGVSSRPASPLYRRA